MSSDNSNYNKLRRALPKEVRLGLLELRKRALANPITKEQSLDPRWMAEHMANYGMVAGPFSIIFSVEQHEDGIQWHLSLAHKDRYPDWDELMMFRSFIYDDDMEVIMVMPPVKEYVNLHKNCFHMWHNTSSHIMKAS